MLHFHCVSSSSEAFHCAKKWDQFGTNSRWVWGLFYASFHGYILNSSISVFVHSALITIPKTTKNTETLSDFRAVSWRCHPDSNWGIKVLQWAKALLSFAQKSLFYGLFCEFCCCRNRWFSRFGTCLGRFFSPQWKTCILKSLVSLTERLWFSIAHTL